MTDDKKLTRVRSLPFKREHRTNAAWQTHGAFALVRGYFCNGLSRRTREGRTAQYLESKFARHCGYDSMDACPITVQIKIKIAVGNLLLLATYEPPADSKNGGRTVMTAQNTLNRICSELGLKPPEKPVQTLQEYLEQGDHEETT